MMPILQIMFLIFMTLKLCGVIDWSWWIVSLPLIGVVIACFVAAYAQERRR